MNHAQKRVSVAVVTGALVIAVVSWLLTSSKSEAVHGGLTIAADIRSSRAATLVRPASSQDVAALVAVFSERLRAACEELPPEHRLESKRAENLVRLASERLLLLLDPSYERYLDHLRQLTGREISQDGEGSFIGGPDAFAKFGGAFKWSPVDPGMAEVRVRWSRGSRIGGKAGGHTYGVPDSKKYYSSVGVLDKDLEAARADVYEAWVPLEAKDTATGGELRVFLVMAFISTPQEPRWMPRFMGINDPTGGDTSLPPPWL